MVFNLVKHNIKVAIQVDSCIEILFVLSFTSERSDSSDLQS